MKEERQVRNVLILLSAVLIAGILGYLTIEGWSFFDSLYMTVITVTTVGYGEVHPLSQAGRAFTIVLIVLGVGAMLYTFTAIIGYVVEGRFGGAVWRRRMKQRLESLNKHFVLCGYGRVGRQIADEFKHDGVPYVVIDINPASLETCALEGCLHVPGDATSDAVLKEAGIERARGLVAAIDNDAQNVYVVLSARALNPNLLIVARASNEDAEAKLVRAGADRVISPYSIAGKRMAMLALRPVVIDFVDTVTHRGGPEMVMESLEVKEGSPFLGLSLVDASVRKADMPSVIAVQKKDGSIVASFEGHEPIEVGDHVIVIGTPSQLKKLEITV